MRRLIQVGVGGYGRTWLDTVEAFRGRVEYAALVDIDPAALEAARRRVGMAAVRCATRLEEVLGSVEADSLLCVVPPTWHESVITQALDAGLHVLSEKPIADTMEASRRIVERARGAEGAFMVSQKGRFHPWVRRFRDAIGSREVGDLSHVTMHYRAPLFRWGFRHTMDDPLLVEMSIHHFDLLRALLGREPVSVAGASWNTPWSGFEGDVAASLRFTFEGGLPVLYEAYARSSGDLTSWYGDIRAECENGAVTFVHPSLYLARRGATQQEHVAAPRQDLVRAGGLEEGQTRAFEEFLDATEQGREPESAGRTNLVSVAMVFAAIDACRSGSVAQIADYVAWAGGSAASREVAPRATHASSS
jgi:predicted dehydrogenase